MFGNLKDAGLVFLNVPFAIVGGVAALHLTGTNFSISAGIGFIALFGICIQDGVLLITVFKHNLEHMHNQSHTLYTAIKLGVNVPDPTGHDDRADGRDWPVPRGGLPRHRIGKLPAPCPRGHRRYPLRNDLFAAGVPADLRLGIP